MVRVIAIVSLMWGAAGSTFAGTWSDAFFEESGRDFGTVPRGMQLSHPFRLVNNTKDRISISGVRVSCGCVSASALKYQLAPGEETVIMANMDSRRFFGHKSVTVYVTFNSPKFDETRLIVQAVARDDLSFNPEVINVGKIKKGDEKSQSMTITFFTSNVNITSVTCDSAFVTPKFKQINQSSGQTIYEIEATMSKDTPVGRWFTDIWVKTNHPNFAKLRVPVTVEVETQLSALPTKVDLGEIKAGSEVDRQVIIRGNQPFRIVNISGADRQVQVRPANQESKTVHIITVTLNPGAVGELKRTIQVDTDLKSNGTVIFDAKATVVP